MATYQVTLSRAHKLVERLKELMKDCAKSVKENLGILYVDGYAGEEQVASLAKREAVGLHQMQKWDEYNRVMIYIRQEISNANAKYGISNMLVTQSGLNLRLNLVTDILKDLDDSTAVSPYQLKEYRQLLPGERSILTRSSTGVKVALGSQSTLDSLQQIIQSTRQSLFALSDKISTINTHTLLLEFPDTIAVDLGLDGRQYSTPEKSAEAKD